MRGYSFIFYLSGEWKTFHRQQMIRAFAKELEGRGNVLCINRPVCPLVTTLKHPGKWKEWFFSRHLEKITGNLFVYTPFVVLHDLLAPKLIGFVSLNRLILKYQLSEVLNTLKFPKDKRVTWFYSAHYVDYQGCLGERYVIYECYDECRYDNDGKFNEKRYLQEIKLLKKADIVLTTAMPLYETRRIYNANTYYSPNGVNCELLSKTLDKSTVVSDGMSKIPVPRIGYVGNIYRFLDFALLEGIAKAKPDWSLVMIGPIDHAADVSRLRILPNIYFMGRIDYLDLPNYLKAINVAIAPFVINNFTRCTDPLKVYEYIAAGRPVVSVRLRELEKFKEFIELVSNDVQAFVSAIENLLNTDTAPRIEQGRQFIQRYSWRMASKRIINIFNKKFNK